ncbi:TPA: hypothetical protein ACRMBV_003051 [Pseudomonas aeruginosa]
MSEVKKISPVGNIYGWEESQFGEFVLSQDYDDLAEEAQALREEVAAAQKSLAFTEQWFAVRHERLWHWAHEELSEEQKRRYFNIVANGTAEHNEPPIYAQQLCRMKHRAESAEQELATLRARAVVPDGYVLMPLEPSPEMRLASHRYKRKNKVSTGPGFWRAMAEAAPRLNGLTVSASALDTLRRFATGKVGHLNNGHCPDDLEGRSARDPNCSVCRALIETDKENGNG